MIIIQPDTKFGGFAFSCNIDEFKTDYANFLKLFHTGVQKIEIIEQDIEDELMVDDTVGTEIMRRVALKVLSQTNNNLMIWHTQEEVFSLVKDRNNNIKLFKINTLRFIKNKSNFVSFEIAEESDGTQRIIDFIPFLIFAPISSKTYLIDEIDRSLHPELTRKIVETFLSNSKKIENQLIATTHESSLLDLELLRRDEIWFVEKNQEGASKMYSLEQFKPRYDAKIRKSYLEGRFGAIPFVPSVENLEWLKPEN